MPTQVRPVPGESRPEVEMSEEERRHAAALMRVNHCGEICAQSALPGPGLDVGQRGTSRRRWPGRPRRRPSTWPGPRGALRSWRGGRKSLLNPLWYGGSLAIGVLAARFGDRANLGFLAETERQVEAHLKSHLTRLPEQDLRSMGYRRADEGRRGGARRNSPAARWGRTARPGEGGDEGSAPGS